MRHGPKQSVLNTALRWLRNPDRSPENRNILYFGIDTALQGIMMGGIFTFISVFAVRLGASKLMVSLLSSLPSIVMMLFSLPAGQFVQQRRNLIRVTNRTRLFHRGSFVLVALLPFFLREHLVEAILVVWSVKSIGAAGQRQRHAVGRAEPGHGGRGRGVRVRARPHALSAQLPDRIPRLGRRRAGRDAFFRAHADPRERAHRVAPAQGDVDRAAAARLPADTEPPAFCAL